MYQRQTAINLDRMSQSRFKSKLFTFKNNYINYTKSLIVVLLNDKNYYIIFYLCMATNGFELMVVLIFDHFEM